MIDDCISTRCSDYYATPTVDMSTTYEFDDGSACIVDDEALRTALIR